MLDRDNTDITKQYRDILEKMINDLELSEDEKSIFLFDDQLALFIQELFYSNHSFSKKEEILVKLVVQILKKPLAQSFIKNISEQLLKFKSEREVNEVNNIIIDENDINIVIKQNEEPDDSIQVLKNIVAATEFLNAIYRHSPLNKDRLPLIKNYCNHAIEILEKLDNKNQSILLPMQLLAILEINLLINHEALKDMALDFNLESNNFPRGIRNLKKKLPEQTINKMIKEIRNGNIHPEKINSLYIEVYDLINAIQIDTIINGKIINAKGERSNRDPIVNEIYILLKNTIKQIPKNECEYFIKKYTFHKNLHLRIKSFLDNKPLDKPLDENDKKDAIFFIFYALCEDNEIQSILKQEMLGNEDGATKINEIIEHELNKFLAEKYSFGFIHELKGNNDNAQPNVIYLSEDKYLVIDSKKTIYQGDIPKRSIDEELAYWEKKTILNQLAEVNHIHEKYKNIFYNLSIDAIYTCILSTLDYINNNNNFSSSNDWLSAYLHELFSTNFNELSLQLKNKYYKDALFFIFKESIKDAPNLYKINAIKTYWKSLYQDDPSLDIYLDEQIIQYQNNILEKAKSEESKNFSLNDYEKLILSLFNKTDQLILFINKLFSLDCSFSNKKTILSEINFYTTPDKNDLDSSFIADTFSQIIGVSPTIQTKNLVEGVQFLNALYSNLPLDEGVLSIITNNFEHTIEMLSNNDDKKNAILHMQLLALLEICLLVKHEGLNNYKHFKNIIETTQKLDELIAAIRRGKEIDRKIVPALYKKIKDNLDSIQSKLPFDNQINKIYKISKNTIAKVDITSKKVILDKIQAINESEISENEKLLQVAQYLCINPLPNKRNIIDMVKNDGIFNVPNNKLAWILKIYILVYDQQESYFSNTHIKSFYNTLTPLKSIIEKGDELNEKDELKVEEMYSKCENIANSIQPKERNENNKIIYEIITHKNLTVINTDHKSVEPYEPFNDL